MLLLCHTPSSLLPLAQFLIIQNLYDESMLAHSDVPIHHFDLYRLPSNSPPNLERLNMQVRQGAHMQLLFAATLLRNLILLLILSVRVEYDITTNHFSLLVHMPVPRSTK